MRKSLVIFFIILSIFAFADDSIIFSDLPGSYAIYHDFRFETEVFIGLCYIGDNTILSRSYEPKTGNEIILSIPFVKTTNGIEIGRKLNLLKGDLNSSEASNRLVPMIMNWANSWYSSKENITKKGKYSISTDDDFSYYSWIPLFQINKIGTDDRFTLITIGKVDNLKDPRFFNFTQIPKPIKSKTYQIKKGKLTNITIDGIKVVLDTNWHTMDNKVYRITNATPQDSVFLIETFDYRNIGFKSIEQYAQILLIGDPSIVVLADGTDVKRIEGGFNITIRMYDPIENKVTLQKTHIIERDKTTISLASLACYESLYLDNKSFFDDISY